MEVKSTEWRPGPTVCRCCLSEGCYKDISTEYFWMGKREVYAEMLSETFDVTIGFSKSGGPNSNSRLICEPCISRLRDASEFKRQVLECEKTFMQHLDPGTSTSIDLDISMDVEKEVKLERVKTEKRLSDDEFDGHAGFDDDDDDDLDDEPLTKLASKVPKKESVDLLDLLDNAKVAEKRKSTTKTKSTPARKSKKETIQPTPSKTVKIEKKKKDINGEGKQNAAKKNAIIILKHTTAYPFRQTGNSVGCPFCNLTFDDPSLFRSHFDTAHAGIHKSPNDNQRVDVTDLRCKSCVKTFVSLEMVARHLNEEHGLNVNTKQSLGLVPLKLEKNRFACVVCEKKFTSLSQLSRHTGTHYCTNILCDVCGKGFETRKGVETHASRNHSTAKHWCRYCKKFFTTQQEKKEHVRSNKRCMPFACGLCEERFLFWERRERHHVEVHGKPKKTFRCTECDKVFEQRTLLYLHFKSTHTEDYKCQQCDVKFSTSRQLREHTNDHTGEKPFKCSVCDKGFARHRTLTGHMLIHDESKKAKCSVCSRLFVQLSKLKLHVKGHHPDVYMRQFSDKT